MPQGGGSTTSTTVATPWPGAQEFLKNAYAQGEQMYNAGPPPFYPGQTVASQSPYTQAATGLTAERGLNGSPLVSAAQNGLGPLAGGQVSGSYMPGAQQAQGTFSNIQQQGAGANALANWAMNPLAGMASGGYNPAAGLQPAAQYGISQAIGGAPINQGSAMVAGRQLGNLGGSNPMGGLLPAAQQGYLQSIASPGAVNGNNYGAMQNGFNAFATGANNIVSNPALGQAGGTLQGLTGANAAGYGMPAAQGATAGIAAGQGAFANPGIVGTAQGNLQSNLAGSYLSGGNPYFDQAVQAAIRPTVENFQRTVVPGITSGAEGAGRYGSGAMYDSLANAGEALNKQVADTAATMSQANYENERGRQMQALGLAQGANQQDLAAQLGASGQLFGLYGTDVGARQNAANTLLGYGQGQNALDLSALSQLGNLYQGDRAFGLNAANSGIQNYLTGTGQQQSALNSLLGQYGNSQALAGQTGLGALNADLSGGNQQLAALSQIFGNQNNATGQALNAAGQAQGGLFSALGNQLGAAQLSPTLANQDYLDLSMLAGAGQTQDAYNQSLINADINRYNYGVNAPQDWLNQWIAQLNNTPFGQKASTNAGEQSGLQSALGTAGQVMQIAGPLIAMAMMCWVAREVYGAANPRWLRMRQFMLTKAPAAVREFYLEHGPAIAGWLRQNPEHKPAMRATMDRLLAMEA